nr:uncharacterized protein LOC118084324 [Zootoca vivipara]
MGSSSTKQACSPLQCFIDNWKKATKGDDWGYPLKATTLFQHCHNDWPLLNTGWPEDGTLNSRIVTATWVKIVNDPSLAAWAPYVDTWKRNVDENPPWLQKCRQAPNQAKICAVQKKAGKTQVLPTQEEEEDFIAAPPPYPTAPPALPTPHNPPGIPDPLGALGTPIARRTRNAIEGRSSPIIGVKGKLLRNYRMELVERYKNEIDMSPIRLAIAGCKNRKKKQELWDKAFEVALRHEEARIEKEEGEESEDEGAAVEVITAPLRRVYDALGPANAQGVVPPRTHTMQYVPFSTTDLYNWRNQTKSFEEDPEGLIKLVESVMKTYNPTFDDCTILLNALLSTEEVRKVHEGVRQHMVDTNVPEDQRANRYPMQAPNWDYNTADGITSLGTYRELLIHGMRRAARRPINMSKVSEIIQKADETPGAFLERLKVAYRRFTPINPDDVNQHAIVKAAFVGQSASDIRKKIQKRDNFMGETLDWMLALAQKTYGQREEEEGRKKEAYRAKKLMALGAVTSGPQSASNSGARQKEGRGRGHLGHNQCAICKQWGHWKRECPNQNQGQPAMPLPMGRGQWNPRGMRNSGAGQGRGRGQGWPSAAIGPGMNPHAQPWQPPQAQQSQVYGAMALYQEDEY